jgi:D-xylose 1-dehydrogenase (NADP+, D-xylono-1,5-lactone-forming)
MCFGGKPVRVNGVAQLDNLGVDRTTMVTMEFAGGELAQVCCSFSAAYSRHAMIMGDKGHIETNYANHPPMGEPPMLKLKRGTAAVDLAIAHDVPHGNGFLLETEQFVALVRSGKGWLGANETDSLDIAQTVDAIKKSIKTGAWESV